MPSHLVSRNATPIGHHNPAEVIAEVLHLALEPMPLAQLLAHVLDALFRVPWLGVMSKGSIFLVNASGTQLNLMAQRHLPDELLARCQNVAFGHCICGRAAATGKFTHVSCLDHRHEVRYDGIAPHGHVCVPIKAGGKLLGVLNLYVDVHQSIDPEAERFLTAVTNTLAGVIERKRAEQALAESEARYRNLVETVNDWVWEVDENGVYTYVSPRIRELLGYEPQEVLGHTPFDLMPPAEAQRIGTIFARIVQHQEPFARLENTNRHKDGREVVLETSGTPIFDDAGRFRGYRGVDRDITDKKRAEERFRSLVELAPDAVVIADQSGRIVLLNRCAEELFGYDRHELLGHEIEVLIPEDARAHHVALRDAYMHEPVQRPMGTGRYVHGRHKNGTVFPVNISLGTLPTEDGHLITAVIRDITEFRRSEDELTRLASVAAHGPNPIIELDTRLALLDNNAEAGLRFPGLGERGVTHPILSGIDLKAILRGNQHFIARHVEFEGRVYEQKIGYMRLLDRIRIYMWDVTDAPRRPGRANNDPGDVPIPGLLHHEEFERHLGRALFHARNSDSVHALLHLRLHGLERIYQECGDPAGTEAMSRATQILAAQIMTHAAAVAPDRMNVLLPDCARDCAEEIAHRIQRALSEFCFLWKSRTWCIEPVVGVAIIDKLSPPPQALLRAAEHACYHASQTGAPLYVLDSSTHKPDPA